MARWLKFQSKHRKQKGTFLDILKYHALSFRLPRVCLRSSIQNLVILSIFGLCLYESIQLGALQCKLWQVCEAGVSLLSLCILLIWLPVFFFCRPLLPQHDAAGVYAYTRSSHIFRNVPPQLSVLVASGQLSEWPKAHVEEILLWGRCSLLRLVTPLMVVRLTGPLQPQVVQLGVNALLWGRLEAASVEAGEHGPLLWRQHIQRVSSLLQAELTPLHAADGGGSLELVVDLDAQAPPGFAELCSYVSFPFSCVSFKLSNLWQQDNKERIRREYVI